MAKATKPQGRKWLLEHRDPWAERLETALHLICRDLRELGATFNVSYKTVDSWMLGRTQPSFDKLLKIRELTGISLEWLLAGSGPPHLRDGNQERAAESSDRINAPSEPSVQIVDPTLADDARLFRVPPKGGGRLKSPDPHPPREPVPPRARRADRTKNQ